jgi:hypothetical protein
MNAKTINMMILALLPAALLTSCSSSSQPPPAVGSARVPDTKGVPGGVIVQTITTSATVVAMDQAEREATLLGPDGKKFTVKMRPEAVGLEQVRVGDRVTATVTQRVVASLDKEGATSGDGTAAVVALPPKGSEPGSLAAGTTQMTAKVIAFDLEKRTATLRFEDGQTETLPIRNDVDLN